MGRKARQKRSSPRGPHVPLAGSTSSARPQTAKRKHRWFARFAASVLVPALLLGLVEIALRAGGFGYSTRFFEPTGDGKTLTTNPKFAWQFYPRATATSPTPLLFPKEKSPGTFRIFILGESAAAGTPDPAFGFARMLELILGDQYPSHRFEVINAAMRGVDSHIIRQIARECAELAPDLFVIYMGNNELVGLHAPSPGEFRFTSNIRLQRLQHAIKRTKLAQLGESLLGRLSRHTPSEKQDMELFRRNRLAFDDSRRDATYRNCGRNLADICRDAETARAKAIVCSVGVNLRDFPPLGSLHRRDLKREQLTQWDQFFAAGVAAESRREFASALASYQSSARLDDHFAELLFRMARCDEGVGNIEQARGHYDMARDWDAMQFRTDSRLNGVTRSVATNLSPNVRFVDMEKSFAASPLAELGIPGRRLFHEHVHFTFAGDHHVASALAPEVAAALQLAPSARAPLSRDECARRLAYTPIDDLNVKAAMARLTANPPFLDQVEHATRQAAADAEVQQRLQQATTQDVEQALAVYRQAMQARPDDWMLRFNFANLLTQSQQPRAAASELAKVVERLPGQRAFRFSYGNALLQAGQRSEAAAQFEAALHIDPDFKPAQQGLRAARGGR